MYFIIRDADGDYLIIPEREIISTDTVIRGPYAWEKAVQEMANLEEYLLPPIPDPIPDVITSIPL